MCIYCSYSTLFILISTPVHLLYYENHSGLHAGVIVCAVTVCIKKFAYLLNLWKIDN